MKKETVLVYFVCSTVVAGTATATAYYHPEYVHQIAELVEEYKNLVNENGKSWFWHFYRTVACFLEDYLPPYIQKILERDSYRFLNHDIPSKIVFRAATFVFWVFKYIFSILGYW